MRTGLPTWRQEVRSLQHLFRSFAYISITSLTTEPWISDLSSSHTFSATVTVESRARTLQTYFKFLLSCTKPPHPSVFAPSMKLLWYGNYIGSGTFSVLSLLLLSQGSTYTFRTRMCIPCLNASMVIYSQLD